ncbi:MAG: hypothetical protein Q8R36_05760 [bacterium]|nr:hypothetical protein [bacterium]
MSKRKIYFLPQYIGPLKHFERFIPYLKDTYDIGFLFISGDDVRRRELIEYCKNNQYSYSVIEKGLKGKSKFHIPFFTPIKNRYDHSMACRSFLENVKPDKIIATKSRYPYDTIFKEANKMNIDTIVLQWSVGLLTRQMFGTTRKKTLVRNTYHFLLEIFMRLLDVFCGEQRFRYTPAAPKKIGVFTFTEEDAHNYIKEGLDPNVVHIVGPVEFQVTHELKTKIDSNLIFRKELFNKYGLTEDKIKIFVNLFRFHVIPLPKKYKMTNEEHVNHHLSLFKMIRSVFPREEADIILRIHPRESEVRAIYEPYKKLGVKIYFNESKTEELVCLSDLYVGDPTSSVNYMVLASNIPAIFTNFSNLTAINNLGKNFYIKHIVTDEKEFVSMLKQFKMSTLTKQYDNTNINLQSVDKTIELINL